MFKSKIDVIYEPKCDLLSERHAISIPVCRDKLREKYSRIEQWRKEGYKFEKIEPECTRCKG